MSSAMTRAGTAPHSPPFHLLLGFAHPLHFTETRRSFRAQRHFCREGVCFCKTSGSATASSAAPAVISPLCPCVAQGVSPLRLPQILPAGADPCPDPSDRDPIPGLRALPLALPARSISLILCPLPPSPASNFYFFLPFPPCLLLPAAPPLLASRPVTQAAAIGRILPTQGTDAAVGGLVPSLFYWFLTLFRISASPSASPPSLPAFLLRWYLPGAQPQGGDLHLVAELHAGDGHGAAVRRSVRRSEPL